MYQEILESLGLSPNEAKIYEALVARGESSISQVAVGAGVHRRNAYDTIQRLVDKGLCFPIISSTENRYSAVDPDKLMELAAEKQRQLEGILPTLKQKFQKQQAPEEAYLYRGLEGQKNVWRDVLRVGKPSYFIGAKGGWFDPRITASRDAFFKEANRKGIRFIQLFDHDVKEKLPDLYKNFPGKLEYRFLPKGYSTNSAIHIFGYSVVTYTGMRLGGISDKTVFFVLRSSDLAESFRTWFQCFWDLLTPETKNRSSR